MNSFSSNHSKTTTGQKIPQFHEKNFTMWKSHAKMVLESMDYSKLDIIKHVHHVPIYQPIKDNFEDSDEIEKPTHQFTEEEKHLVSLDVKASAAIGNATPYNIYHLFKIPDLPRR